MTFSEFKAWSFPERSEFDRPQFPFHTNLVKWFAMRFAYLLYRGGMTANLVDVLGMFLALAGFLCLQAAPQSPPLAIVGLLLLYLYVFLDFVDGPIAKARGECTAIGSALDNIGTDLARVAFLGLLGLFSESPWLTLANIFAGIVLVFLIPNTQKELPREGVVGKIVSLYTYRYSFIGVRFMLVLLPLFLTSLILSGGSVQGLAQSVSIFYGLAATLWMVLLVPQVSSQSRPPAARTRPLGGRHLHA